MGTWHLKGIHWPGRARNKALLILSLESIEIVDFVLSPETLTVVPCPHPRYVKPNPRRAAGEKEKEYPPQILFSPPPCGYNVHVLVCS